MARRGCGTPITLFGPVAELNLLARWGGENALCTHSKRRGAVLNDRGFTLDRPTDAPGFYYKNPSTNEEVRIMERPDHRWGNDPAEKHYYGYYYRYRPNRNLPFGNHTPIPDKN